MLNYIKKYKKDSIALSILTFIFVIIAILFFQRQGDFRIDCGREAYLAQKVLEGLVSYRDFFNVYGPLSYQINGLLFKIFGIHLNTLFIAGNLIAYGIMLCTYFISRIFNKQLISFSVAFLITIIGVANINLFNFVFTYAFAMTYALLSVLLSTLFLLKHFRTQKPLYLALSFFFCGFSITSKLDFVGCLIILTIYSALAVKNNYKQHLVNITAFLITPIISWGTLFLQGLTIQNLIDTIPIYKGIWFSEGNTYYQHVLMQNTGFEFNILCQEILIIGITFALYTILSKSKSKILNIFIVLLAQIPIAIVTDNSLFSYITIALTLLIIPVVIEYFRNKKIEDIIFITLTILTILLAARNYGKIKLHYPYGLYNMPLLIVCFTTFFTTYLPKYLKLKNQKLFMVTTSIVLILISTKFLSNNLYTKTYSKKISTNYGSIYVNSNLYEGYTNILNLIETNKHKRILILPEGAMFNFLTQTESSPYYYSMTSMNLEGMGEDRIIKYLEENPDLKILLTNYSSPGYNKDYICVDYGKKLCKYLNNRR